MREIRTFVGEYEIREPAPILSGLMGYSRLLLLVRDRGVPIDVVSLPHNRTRFARLERDLERDIRDRVGILPFLRSRGRGSHTEPPFNQFPVSVIVCTKDRPRSLAGCLASLARLDYGPFETIVVDNASRGRETRDIVRNTPFRYVREERQGLNWARNRGLREALHGIVAYVDDDVRVDPAWLAGIARGFGDSGVAGVTGLVLPAELETQAQGLFELYGGMGKGTTPRMFRGERLTPRELISVQHVGVGANMAFRREVLEALDGFDTALDVGTPSGGAGDLDMFHRVLRAGGTIRYEPRALVWHRHRRSMDSLRNQLFCNGQSYGVYLLKMFRDGKIPRLSVATQALFRWGYWLTGRLALGVLRRHRFPLRLIWAEWWGALHAPWAYVATYRHDRSIRDRFPTDTAETASGG